MQNFPRRIAARDDMLPPRPYRVVFWGTNDLYGGGADVPADPAPCGTNGLYAAGGAVPAALPCGTKGL